MVLALALIKRVLHVYALPIDNGCNILFYSQLLKLYIIINVNSQEECLLSVKHSPWDFYVCCIWPSIQEVSTLMKINLCKKPEGLKMPQEEYGPFKIKCYFSELDHRTIST